jgi:hypothetical protein
VVCQLMLFGWLLSSGFSHQSPELGAFCHEVRRFYFHVGCLRRFETALRLAVYDFAGKKLTSKLDARFDDQLRGFSPRNIRGLLEG